MEITLEKVDLVRERTGVSYGDAKKALEAKNGDVLEAIIHIEEVNGINNDKDSEHVSLAMKSESMDEFKVWLKDLINKGNVSRIRISKEGTEIIDVPVNAGIAAGVIAVIIPAILAFGVLAAVVTKVTIELTMVDGRVEVINKYISKAAVEVKDKANDIMEVVKEKIENVKDGNVSVKHKENSAAKDDIVYSYTVNFDEEE